MVTILISGPYSKQIGNPSKEEIKTKNLKANKTFDIIDKEFPYS